MTAQCRANTWSLTQELTDTVLFCVAVVALVLGAWLAISYVAKLYIAFESYITRDTFDGLPHANMSVGAFFMGARARQNHICSKNLPTTARSRENIRNVLPIENNWLTAPSREAIR